MIAFNCHYMLFDGRTEPYQRADDVGYAISEFLWFDGHPFYPASALAQAKVAQINLCAAHANNPDNYDLIFQMPKADGGHFYEIVMRSDAGTSYGGWAWGEALECLDQNVSGYRVLRTYTNDSKASFEYVNECRSYKPASNLHIDKASFRIARQNAMLNR